MLRRSLCVQEFTGPSIELSRDGGEVFYRVVAGLRSLRKVLPEQSIGIPIRAGLSGAAGSQEYAGTRLPCVRSLLETTSVPRPQMRTAQMDWKSR